MLELGLACDGGKDSLSMAASAGGETVMAPGNLVVSAYVPCPDITLTVRFDRPAHLTDTMSSPASRNTPLGA
jgi:phosphoribosylformylglycinamidine synthase